MSTRWLSRRQQAAKYSLTEATLLRLVRLGVWPPGVRVTSGRVVAAEQECDKAMRKLISEAQAGRAVSTTPPEQAEEYRRKKAAALKNETASGASAQ